MTTTRGRLSASSSAVLVLLAALPGCKRREPAATDPLVERACASACAALTASDCPSDEPTEARQAACVAACLASRATAEVARCAAEHQAYLACVSALDDACAPRGMAAGTALENRSGVPGCEREHAAYFQCTSVCREPGVVRSRSARLVHAGRERSVQAELVTLGCGPERRAPVKRSPAGAPCTHHTVCSAVICSCPRRGVEYSARACVDGRCADAAAACSVAPRAVAHDPCR